MHMHAHACTCMHQPPRPTTKGAAKPPHPGRQRTTYYVYKRPTVALGGYWVRVCSGAPSDTTFATRARSRHPPIFGSDTRAQRPARAPTPRALGSTGIRMATHSQAGGRARCPWVRAPCPYPQIYGGARRVHQVHQVPPCTPHVESPHETRSPPHETRRAAGH